MKMNTTFKRFLSLALVLSVLLGWALPANALENSLGFRQVSNDRVFGDLFDREPANIQENVKQYADTDSVRVSIILEEAGTIDAGFSPEGIAFNKAAMEYRASLKSEQVNMVEEIEAATDEELDVVWYMTLAANLISANVKYGQVDEIAKVPGVKAVIVEEPYNPAVVDSSVANPDMATSGVQTGAPITHAAGYTGAGSRIAIIDTGLDVEHISFDAGAFNYSLANLAGKSGKTIDEYIAGLDLLDAEEIAKVLSKLNVMDRMSVDADDLYVNSKIPFGFNYIDEDLDIVHENDQQGSHGSHVAGIAAANTYVPKGDGSYESAIDSVFAQGIAPDAQLIIMKVFGKAGGAYPSDYMVAIEDAIMLGADAVNLSLGTAYAGMSYPAEAAYQIIMNNLVNSGTVVTMSAGNEGAWSDNIESGYIDYSDPQNPQYVPIPYLYLDDVNMLTAGNSATYTNSLAVASVDNAGFTAPCFFMGEKGVPYVESLKGYGNQPIATIAGDTEYEYVFLNGIGAAEEYDALGVSLQDKIVLCYRGTTNFSVKANEAAKRGAKAVAIVNNDVGGILLDLTGYEYTVPVVSLFRDGGEVFKAQGTPIVGADQTILGWTGTVKISAGPKPSYHGNRYHTMSSFSSWGVPGDLSLKPEITAPGGEIHSVGGAYREGNQMVYGDHASYEVMSGTSMAAPQVAGMAALVAQYIREKGLEEKTGVNIRALAQSLLMSTAVPILDGNNGGYYYPVIQQGAGLANVSAAVMADSYLMMGADATDSYADGKIKVELGDDPAKKGEYTFTFYINNLTDEEKTFLLSADFFTQGAFGFQGALYMDLMTTPLAPNVTWTVNGKAVDTGANLVGMDFNGDGYINTKDGQAILDFAVGARAAIENAALADIDKDNDVDSYDAYLFFQMLGQNGAVVPANGKAEVQVTVKLTDDDKAWLSYYENGAYLQGFVYAESMVSVEGVEGTSHSIPVLGFYGNWSDASMYDKGSYVEYAHGDETRLPYLVMTNMDQNTGDLKYNGLTVTYHDDPGTEYWFGGNPYITDDVYKPERNAFNAINGDMVTSLGFAPIRNAAAVTLDVWDPVTGRYYMSQFLEDFVPSYAAYYTPSNQSWNDTYNKLNLTGLNFSALPNNTPLEIGITSVLEYYVADDGSINWAALGDGAYLSVPFVIDNTAPVLDDVKISMLGDTMEVVVTDNQYIAAVALYDSFGQYLHVAEGSKNQNAGDTVTYTLDVSRVNGAGFLLQVYDYACNTVTYEINAQIGEVTNDIEKVVISENSLAMIKGNTKQLQAVVMPVNAVNRQINWSSSNNDIVSVDANGVVVAKAAGTAVITATSVADPTKTATCQVVVSEISVDLNAIVWDEMGGVYYSSFNTAALPAYQGLSQPMPVGIAAACTAPNGTIYGATYGEAVDGLYAIDPVTYETTKMADAIIQGQSIFYSDLTYLPGSRALLASYGPYVISLDPATGTPLGIIEQFGAEIVGIAHFRDYVYQGTYLLSDVFVILNDGTIAHRAYSNIMDEMVLFGTYEDMHAGVSVGSAWYFNSAYFDGNYLFWAAFQRGVDDQVSLYAVDLLNTGETFMLGQFPVDVWPVGGLHQNVSAPPAGNNSVDTSELTVVLNDENPEYDISAYVASKKQTPVPHASARPMSDAVVEEAQDMITVKVTAGDLAAAATDRFTNGVTSVSYDAEALELKSVIVNGDYVASVKEEGKVTFGYVDLDGVAPDTVVATLVFDAKSADAKPVKITYIEANNEKPASSEDVNVDYPHEHTEVQNAKEATCTEPGYTGDVYCHDCKTIIVKGEEIKPTGHQNTEIQGAKEATCTEPGYTGDVYCHDCKTIIAKGEEIKPTGHQNTEIQGAKEATYTEPGYTGDTYCHDCKTVVAKGKEIPVKKVEGEGPPKTDDPFSFGMGFVLMMTSVSAMAVLTVVYKKKYRA